MEGQQVSGDAHLVKTFDGGVLVAAIDGLGHGEGAAEAAKRAVDTLALDPSLPAGPQMLRVHEALRGSRGVVMSLARFDATRSELTWTGVGNVEGVLFRVDPTAGRRRESLLVFGGVVGGLLAGVRTTALPVHKGDMLMFATDGVRGDFASEVDVFSAPKTLADGTLRRYGRANDDALVVVARWIGAGVS